MYMPMEATTRHGAWSHGLPSVLTATTSRSIVRVERPSHSNGVMESGLPCIRTSLCILELHSAPLAKSLDVSKVLMERKDFEVRTIYPDDREWISKMLNACWGSTVMVSRGVLHDILAHPGFVALQDGEPVGLLAYNIVDDECELTLMQSMRQGIGVGSALINAVKRIATLEGCARLWLITTNDNLRALHFYQKRGFTLAAVHPNALAQSRLLKPQIPLVGMDGIPLRDEIELEMVM